MNAANERPFSAQWYRVADLRPRLRPHALIHRHVYRGQVWFVLQDRMSSRLHRFTPAANVIIGLMDGERTVRVIWEAAGDALGDQAPTQDEVIDVLTRLHQADLLQTEARPDARETGARQAKGRRLLLGQRLGNPMALRIPLMDPEPLLQRMLPAARWLFSVPMAVAWLLLVLVGLAVAAGNAAELATHATQQAFTASNVALLAVVFPLVKLLHELGHALAVKRWGGQVHEVGIMLLVLAPVPYVDASGAAAFSEKHRRIAVSAAGIAVEMALAALAVLVWREAAPGMLRDVAFDIMLIGGVSTVLFNGNPLLRFDGYYVLADLIEIPNLAQRSRRYLGYLILRHGFGAARARSPVTAPGEAPWFLLYGVTSGVYRLLVAIAIIAFVASQFFIVGIILALLAATQLLVVPLLRQSAFLVGSPLLAGRRVRAIGLISGVIVLLFAALVVLPAPLATRAEGVVWLADDAGVRAAASGFVRRAAVDEGRRVRAGQLLFALEDPVRDAELEVLTARLRELQVEAAVEAFRDRVRAAIVEERIRVVRAEVEREQQRAAGLEVRSPIDGILVYPDGIDPVGRFVRQGEVLAVVVSRAGLSVRAVVEQPDIALVRERLRSVQVRFADRPERTLDARLMREVPAADFRLPSRVLGNVGGGRIPVKPGDDSGLEVSRRIFQVELALPEGMPLVDVGQRVHVRFGHGEEPLAWQWSRRLEQVFLRRFGA